MKGEYWIPEAGVDLMMLPTAQSESANSG